MENITIIGIKKTTHQVQMGYTHNGESKLLDVAVEVDEEGKTSCKFLNEKDMPSGKEFLQCKIGAAIMADSYVSRKIREGDCANEI